MAGVGNLKWGLIIVVWTGLTPESDGGCAGCGGLFDSRVLAVEI